MSDDPSPKRALIVAVLMIIATLIASWLQTEWKYEKRKTETNEQVGVCAAICGLHPRGMEGLPDHRTDPRTEAIRRFLESHNPSMSGFAARIVDSAVRFGADPYLVVAIGSLESAYFRSCLGGNCWGHRGSRGYIRYGTLAEGIEAASKLLGSRLYAGKTIEAIGKVYAEDPAWSAKVATIYGEIKNYEM